MTYEITPKEKKLAIMVIVAFIVTSGLLPTNMTGNIFIFNSIGQINISRTIPNNNVNETTMNINIESATVQVFFTNGLENLAIINFTIDRTKYEQYGDPIVNYTNDVININYNCAEIMIYLSNNIKYNINANISAGTFTINYSNNAKIGNINTHISAGTIVYYLDNITRFTNNVTTNLIVDSGVIYVTALKPSSVGTKITALVDTGEIELNSTGYSYSVNTATTKIGQSLDYSSATYKLDIMAYCKMGRITLFLR